MSTSQKPYLLRALYEWCVDNGHTPYIVVWVDEHTQVPREYVKDNEIVLNVGPTASHGLKIDSDWVSFSARFGGQVRELWIPVGNVLSLFARETGEGMGFELEQATPPEPEPPQPEPSRPAARPALRIVK